MECSFFATTPRGQSAVHNAQDHPVQCKGFSISPFILPAAFGRGIRHVLR